MRASKDSIYREISKNFVKFWEINRHFAYGFMWLWPVALSPPRGPERPWLGTVPVSEGWKTARNQRFLFEVPCRLAYAQVVGTTRGGQEG